MTESVRAVTMCTMADCPLCGAHPVCDDGAVACDRIKDPRIEMRVDLASHPVYPDVWIISKENGVTPVLTSVEGGGYEVTAR